jgi:predicted RNA-binding protein YlxR (DUF448 family)
VIMAKHIPLRSCVACRDNKPKRELVRVVRVSEDRVEIDRTGRKNGRGAYFCPAVECFELGHKRKALNHALSMTVSPENWEELFSYARETLPEHKVPTRVPMQPARKRAAARSQSTASPR